MTTSGLESASWMVAADLDPLEETLTILGDSETVCRLLQSDAELAQGQEVSAAELAASVRRPLRLHR